VYISMCTHHNGPVAKEVVDMSYAMYMYDEQRKKLERLFREHAQQEAAATLRHLDEKHARDRAFAYANWYPPNPAPVTFAGHAQVPTISTFSNKQHYLSQSAHVHTR